MNSIASTITSLHPVTLVVVLLFSIIGTYTTLSLLFSFISVFLPSTPSRKFSPVAGSWAIVTGASDGIGKEFVFQLAKRNFNILLVSRSKDKLHAVAEEAKRLSPEIQTIVYPFDFTDKDEDKFRALKAAISKLDVGVLVNNVGINHSIPIPFLDEDESYNEDIVFVNIIAQLRMTRMVLPQMKARKTGFIINIGSMSAVAPCAYLSVYSATKSFIRAWSQTLAHEVKADGIHVQHVNTHFVSTNMSKMRPTFYAPTPKDYVKAVMKSVGKEFNVTPYPSHAFLNWVFTHFYSESKLIEAAAKMTAKTRQKALAKLARTAKSK